MNLGTAEVIRANSRHLPIADNSVDLVVTSPPYFALRSYQDGGEHYQGQIGDEPTPDEFVTSLLEVTAECVRVLKPSGSLWVNLGDKYAGSRMDGSSGNGSTGGLNTRKVGGIKQQVVEIGAEGQGRKARADVAAKSLIGIPWRYALRCIDELGLILRAEVIWSKPNGLPESVTDRVRRSHEQWFCFEQSGGVEAATESFPFCPLCGRPVDARSTLVARLQEVDRSVEPVDLASEVRSDDGVDGQDAGRGDHDVAVVPGVPAIPVLEALDPEIGVDAAHLGEHGGVPVVDADSQQRATLTPDQRDGALSVDDSGKPADVCECVGHPLIINDEPWIPQSLAAEIMQSVADGECDPQQAADFLSGDYARNHSVWFHFTLSPRYFSAVDEIREEYSERVLDRQRYAGREDVPLSKDRGDRHDGNPARGILGHGHRGLSPLGKLPGSVWTVPTEPLRVPDHLGVDHFAAFPTEWPKRIIQGWSPAGVCVECGEGRRPVVASVGLDMSRPQARRAQELADRAGLTEEHFQALLSVGVSDTGRGKATQSGTGKNTAEVYALADKAREVLGGYAREYLLRRPTGFSYACACPEPTADTTPAVVLDPFGGTGTTALVAKALGRHGISVDMSADYCRLAEWRTNDRDQLAKVLGVAKAEPVAADEQSLLDLLGGESA